MNDKVATQRITEEHLKNIKDIKPLIVGAGLDPEKIKFGNVFPSPFHTTFLCAKRRSGKTSVLAECLEKTSNKNTAFFIFCPTTQVDDSWKTIIEKLQKKGSVVNVFDSIMDGKQNQLNTIIDTLSKGEEEEPVKPIKPVKKLIYDGENQEHNKPQRASAVKPKKISPEYIFVFDDISSELKNPAVYKLLKMSRHLKASVYISTQYIHDIMPQGLKQAEYFILFKSFSEDKLEHLYHMLDLSISLEKFIDIYKYVMKDAKYDFLFIDIKNEQFRKNFNKKLNV